MVSKYHDIIQKRIVHFGENHRKVKRVKTSGHPLHINHPTKNLSLIYNPDVHFQLKNRKIIVFEIADRQSNEKTIADIIRSFLTPNVSQVYFVVPTEEKRKEITIMYDVILSKLADDFGTKKSKLPLDANVIVISKEDVLDIDKLDALLKEYITL